MLPPEVADALEEAVDEMPKSSLKEVEPPVDDETFSRDSDDIGSLTESSELRRIASRHGSL